MPLSTVQESKLRRIVSTLVNAGGIIGRLANLFFKGFLVGVAVACAYVLVTADPATTTFAQFLTFVQSRLTASAGVIGGITWIFIQLCLSPTCPYLMRSSRAGRSQTH